MKIIDNLKRMRTGEFWKRVGYWSAIKWSGKKTEPISKEDWLPVLTSIGIGVIILIVFLMISNYLKK